MTTLISVDPHRVRPNPDNRHHEVSDLDDLLASIPVVGILQPPVVTPVNDDADHDYQLVAGHRRRLAAIELGMTSIAVIVADSTDAAEAVLSMLVENLHRTELTATDEARGYEQLALLDWEPARIAAATDRTCEHVTNALALRKLPDAAQQAADSGQLDLTQAAQLGEFGDEPELLGSIIDKGLSHWGFRHALEQARSKRDKNRAIDARIRELVSQGVKVTKKPAGWPDCPETAAIQLQDADGNYLSPDGVMTERGFRVFIDRAGPWFQVVVYCTDPDEWGYTRMSSTGYKSPQQRLADEERAAAEHAREAALDAAEAVRRQFLTERYRSAKAVRHLHTAIMRDTASRPGILALGSHTRELADTLAGTAIDSVHDTAGPDRLWRILAARWLGHGEDCVRAASGPWANDATITTAVTHLDQLRADGYDLSDAETDLYNTITAADSTEDDEDEQQAQDDDDDVPWDTTTETEDDAADPTAPEPVTAA